MDWAAFLDWLGGVRIWVVGLLLFAVMCLAAGGGMWVRALRRSGEAEPESAGGEGPTGYIVSAVLGLLALLLGFTFSLAVDRFDARRHLVIDEANAIGTTYLRAQLLPEPHRSRLSELLIRYTDNRIALAEAQRGPRQKALLARNDALLVDIWSAADAGFEPIKTLDFSSTFIEGVNTIIDLDASRKAARGARVPPEVFTVLTLYMIATAGVLGYVMKGAGGRLTTLFLLALLTLSLMLIVDIDRPTMGGVTESQTPLETLSRSLKATPRNLYDRWRDTSVPSPPVGEGGRGAAG
jgi:hypothetical protein